MLTAHQEVELVRRALAGDTGAFGELVTVYQRIIYTLALRMTGDHHEAEDVSQAVFLKAYRSLGSFDTRRRFFSWIYRIAVNEGLDRRRTRRPLDPLDERMTDPAPTPDSEAERTELRGLLDRALGDLTEDHRQVIVLKYHLQRSYEEMAEALGISEATVRSRLFEARRKLGRALRQMGVKGS